METRQLLIENKQDSQIRSCGPKLELTIGEGVHLRAAYLMAVLRGWILVVWSRLRMAVRVLLRSLLFAMTIRVRAMPTHEPGNGAVIRQDEPSGEQHCENHNACSSL
jgi:hypothetical protein